MLRNRFRCHALLTLLGLAALFSFATPGRAGPENANPPLSSSSDDGVVVQWLKSVTQIQSEQPHWATPVATVTPRLEQEVRYDQFWEAGPSGHVLNSYGGGKGVEFIPAQNIEVILGIPAYQTRDNPGGSGGFADENLLFKYRLLSGNEQHGDYILTAFLGVTLPVGSDYNTGHHEVTTPTIAFGKGWGDFDIQSTLGISVPDDGAPRDQAGTPVAWNTTLQYHLLDYLWPEVEFNYTWFPNGEHLGENQLYITPGLVLGRFTIDKRFGCTIGAGEQILVADARPAYFHNTILTVRFPF
jgi:hypothetical protein